MLQPQFADLLHVVVKQRIAHYLAVLAVFHGTGISERPKVLGYRRLLHIQHGNKVAYAHLRSSKSVDNLKSPGITKPITNRLLTINYLHDELILYIILP